MPEKIKWPYVFWFFKKIKYRKISQWQTILLILIQNFAWIFNFNDYSYVRVTLRLGNFDTFCRFEKTKLRGHDCKFYRFARKIFHGQIKRKINAQIIYNMSRIPEKPKLAMKNLKLWDFVIKGHPHVGIFEMGLKVKRFNHQLTCFKILLPFFKCFLTVAGRQLRSPARVCVLPWRSSSFGVLVRK